jgi:16S rRNA (guanine527-N7)-methyltransferase
MTEDEARDWVRDEFGGVAVDRLQIFANLVREESAKQNLVSAATLDRIWSRHIVDSAQLISLTNGVPGCWADVGSGAGFPGLVVAILRDEPMMLIEPRKRRVEFLRDTARELGLSNVTVETAKSQNVTGDARIISARAVMSVRALIEASHHLTDADTIWVLPKGLAAREEVAEAKRSWHGTFHVKHSITDPNSLIVVANGVSRR